MKIRITRIRQLADELQLNTNLASLIFDSRIILPRIRQRTNDTKWLHRVSRLFNFISFQRSRSQKDPPDAQLNGMYQ